MNINHKIDDAINLDGEALEEVDTFTYQGSVVGKDGGSDKDINKNREGKIILFNTKTNMEFKTHLHKKFTQHLQLKCQISFILWGRNMENHKSNKQ